MRRVTDVVRAPRDDDLGVARPRTCPSILRDVRFIACPHLEFEQLTGLQVDGAGGRLESRGRRQDDKWARRQSAKCETAVLIRHECELLTVRGRHVDFLQGQGLAGTHLHEPADEISWSPRGHLAGARDGESVDVLDADRHGSLGAQRRQEPEASNGRDGGLVEPFAGWLRDDDVVDRPGIRDREDEAYLSLGTGCARGGRVVCLDELHELGEPFDGWRIGGVLASGPVSVLCARFGTRLGRVVRPGRAAGVAGRGAHRCERDHHDSDGPLHGTVTRSEAQPIPPRRSLATATTTPSYAASGAVHVVDV